jgi:hypothetical protein
MDTASTRRPVVVSVLVGVLGFLGVTALGGGIEMVLFPNGNEYLPIDMMDGVPVLTTFLVPGLVLGGVFGLGSLVAAVGILRRPQVTWLRQVEQRTGRHWSWALAVGLGVGFAAWMLSEWVWLGTPWAAEATPSEQTVTWILYGIYDTVAIALLVLPQLPAVRRFLASPDGPDAARRARPARSTSMV